MCLFLSLAQFGGVFFWPQTFSTELWPAHKKCLG